MTQYFTRIIPCPSCSKKMILNECSSCNTFGAKFYTDGACKGAMYDSGSALLRCSACQSLIWREDINDPEPSEDSLDFHAVMKDPVLRTLPFASPPKRTEYPEILAMAPWNSDSREMYLRVRAWWAMNDSLRSRKSVGKTLTDAGIANMIRLLKLCMADQTPSESNIIRQSELLRELGRFSECLAILDRVFDDRYLPVVKHIRKLAKKGDTWVRLIPVIPKKRIAVYPEYSGTGGAVIIPNKINGLSVVKIKSNVFRSATNLTSVTIPRSVTDIEYNAFSFCTNLAAISVEAHNPVFKSIDGVLFNKSLTTLIQYPPGKVGDYVIPSKVTSIGGQAFCDCSGLSSITIPRSVISIDEGAFNNASSLTRIVIPASVTGIGEGAFSNCPKLLAIEVESGNPEFTSLDGVLFDTAKKVLIQYPGGKASVYTIPENVVSIEDGAFSGCMYLASIIIPSSVTSIGHGAFSGCIRLASIIIPNSVTRIERHAFYGCTSLPSIAIPNSVSELGDGAFSGCIRLAGIIIPNSVIRIERHAFYGCISLSSIAIPNSITELGVGAFWGCSNLANITLGNGIDKLEHDTFRSCGRLIKVNIPLNVVCIEDNVFNECIGLINITIPDSVTSIGESAFEKCSSLTGITISGSVTSWGRRAFSECTSLTDITFGKGITGIGCLAFEKCASLINVTIPDSVNYISYFAFKDCSSITRITIAGNVTRIEAGAFENCTNLLEVCFGGNAPDVDDNLFGDESKTTVYYLPSSTGWGATFGGRPTALWYVNNSLHND
jgi:hypothetical protein